MFRKQPICVSILYLVLVLFTHSRIQSFINNPFATLASNHDWVNDADYIAGKEEWDRELAKLTPEEQKQFHEMAAEVARMIEELPQEEKDQLAQRMNDEIARASNHAKISEVSNTIKDVVIESTTQPVPTTPTVSTVVFDEIKQLANVLQDLRTQLSLFLAKIQSMPLVELKIDTWFHKGKIAHASKECTWSQCAKDLETLLSLIALMLEPDEHSNPIFLFKLHKDTDLELQITEFAERLLPILSLEIIECDKTQEKEMYGKVRDILSVIYEMIALKNINGKMTLLCQIDKEHSRIDQMA